MLSHRKWARTGLAALMVAALLSGFAWAKGKPPKPDPDPDPEPPPPPPVTYQITWLGTLGGPSSLLADMNDSGDVVGRSDTDTGAVHGFLNEAQPNGTRTMTDLNELIPDDPAFDGWEISSGRAINNVGQIVGKARIDGTLVIYRYTPGTEPLLENLSVIPGPVYDMNDEGTIVGSQTGNGAYRYTNALESLNDLIDPESGWNLGSAVAINDAGWIVGGGSLDGVGGRSFLFMPAAEGETYATVVDLGAETTGVFDISEVGDVVGRLENGHAFLYTLLDGLMDLGSFDRKSSSYAFGVNDLGQVVGFSGKFRDRGTLFLALPTTYDLLNVDDLLDLVANDPDTLARWYASNVFDGTVETTIINPLPGESFGQIGSTSTLDSIEEAFILTPIPAPPPEE